MFAQLRKCATITKKPKFPSKLNRPALPERRINHRSREHRRVSGRQRRSQLRHQRTQVSQSIAATAQDSVIQIRISLATPARSMVSRVARRTISSSRPSFTISGRSFSRPSGRVTRGLPRFGIFANYSVRVIVGSNRFTPSSRLRNTAFQSSGVQRFDR